jgi:hypothetical protein
MTEKWDDKDFVLEQVQKNSYSLNYASDRLKDDEAIVLSAVNNRGSVLVYASDRLRSDVNFCIECAKKNQKSIPYFLGGAKELFANNDHCVNKVEEYLKQQTIQNQANQQLLSKLSTVEITSQHKLFKMNLLKF